MNASPRVLAIVPSLIASCQIGVLKPLRALAATGAIRFRWCLESKGSLNDVHWADVIIFCRNTEPAYAHLLNEALSTGKPIIYDLDDNFWDIPFETDPELARYHRLPPRIQQLERYLEQASLVRVYSPVLKDRVSRFNSRAKLLKAGFDFRLVSGKWRPSEKEDVTRIVYATSRIVDDQYHEFLEGMLRVLDRFDRRVELTVWGCQPRELAGRRGVRLLPLLPNYDKFLRAFDRERFDVGLAPLPDTLFHRSKTNTKFRDYGACFVAGVYSDVDVYSTCIEHGVTGILVKNDPDSWYDGISLLVENIELRDSLRKAAYDSVHRQYRQELVEQEWLAEIRELLGSSAGYAATSGINASKQVRIRADFPMLCGVRFPALSPDKEPVGKVLMEVSTPSGNLLREAAVTVCQRSDPHYVRFFFEPILNSKNQEFILRFIQAGDETVVGWLPSAAYIQMLYSSPTMAEPHEVVRV